MALCWPVVPGRGHTNERRVHVSVMCAKTRCESLFWSPLPWCQCPESSLSLLEHLHHTAHPLLFSCPSSGDYLSTANDRLLNRTRRPRCSTSCSRALVTRSMNNWESSQDKSSRVTGVRSSCIMMLDAIFELQLSSSCSWLSLSENRDQSELFQESVCVDFKDRYLVFGATLSVHPRILNSSFCVE